MQVHKRSSACYSSAARDNSRNVHPALKISASPLRKGERIEVRGFLNYSLRRTLTLPSPFGKGEANTRKAVVAGCRAIRPKNAQENWPNKLIAGGNLSRENKTS